MGGSQDLSEAASRASRDHGDIAKADDLTPQSTLPHARDSYLCPAGERFAYHYTNEENGLVLRRYWTNACQSCAIKHRCTTAKERRISPSASGFDRVAIIPGIGRVNPLCAFSRARGRPPRPAVSIRRRR
jgi:hypothetical protein